MAREKSFFRLAAALVAAPLLLGTTPPAQLAQAVAVQRTLVEERPGDAATLNDLANLLVEAGELEEAEEAYRRAMDIEPGRPEPPFNLALLLAANKHPREAQRLLKAMLKEHPEHAWGHYQLGTLQQAKGNRSRALRSYREAFRLDPLLSDPKHNPHVIDNGLATAAMLEAFALVGQATTQRIYAEPTQVSGLFLRPLTSPPAEPAAKPEMDDEMDDEMTEEMTEEVVEEPGG